MPYPAACSLVLHNELALYDRVLEGVLTAQGIGEESDGQDVELGLKWWSKYVMDVAVDFGMTL